MKEYKDGGGISGVIAVNSQDDLEDTVWSHSKVIDSIRDLIGIIGVNPDREDVRETPVRFFKMMMELTESHRDNERGFLESLKRDFEVGGDVDQMIVVRQIPFISLCSHHLAQVEGKATVGYVPAEGRVLGISKLARVVRFYSRMLTMQEVMTGQIAKAVEGLLPTLGVGVWVEAKHSCMSIRGVQAYGATTVTSDLRGIFREAAVRNEFLSLAREVGVR